jgi:hypothetical protein
LIRRDGSIDLPLRRHALLLPPLWQ